MIHSYIYIYIYSSHVHVYLAKCKSVCSNSVILHNLVVDYYSIFFQAESRLAAKRAARAEARGIRHREIEKQQREVSIDISFIRAVSQLNMQMMAERW